MLAIVISIVSLLLAAVSLGWNIYRDIILKPRLKISLMDAVITRGEKDPPKRITLIITNFGPGKTRVMGLHLRKTSFFRKIFRKEKYAFLQHDYEDPLSGKIPCELEVGQQVNLTFRHLPYIFLEKDWNQIGATDPFGKTYWCGSKNYREVKKSYLKNKTSPDTRPQGME